MWIATEFTRQNNGLIKKKILVLECDNCGTSFYKRYDLRWINLRKNHYCSKRCGYDHHIKWAADLRNKKEHLTPKKRNCKICGVSKLLSEFDKHKKTCNDCMLTKSERKAKSRKQILKRFSDKQKIKRRLAAAEQIDHIIPQSLLPYTSMGDENFKKCWALENLRPYSSKQNLLDGNRRAA